MADIGSPVTGRHIQFSVRTGRTRPLSTLAELTNMAVLMASDQARGMTGTVVNVNMGSLDD
jgi:hypothetical protein